MSISKNFFNREVPTRNLITTISGILLMAVQLVITVLLVTGKITSDQVQPLNELLAGIIAAGTQIVGYVAALILMFRAKD
jgi:hypothetical protein